MSSSKQRVLVTGSSGFLGGHIVEGLLKAGYAVRGAIRSAAKAEELRKRFNTPDYDIVVIDDLVAGDFSAALKGISSVIHVASPTMGTNHVEVARGGTLNVFRQAYNAGVFKLTLIGSFFSNFTEMAEVLDSSVTITDKDWRVVDEEALKQPDLPLLVAYPASKALGEKVAWEFAEAHPKVDLITLLPSYFYGPLSPYTVVTDMGASISTDLFLYELLGGQDKELTFAKFALPQYVDVRDVARAAVLSLSAPAKPGQQRRRILLSGPTPFSMKEVVKHIAAVRPALKSRLVRGGDPEGLFDETGAAVLDTSKAAEVLGITKWIDWKQMVEDTVDSILKMEATLKA